jgi:Uma2 family endonuclease
LPNQPQRRYSLDDYFAVEATAVTRHEYYRGEIFAMAGASLRLNALTALRVALAGRRCEAFGSDLRIGTPSGLFTYPDVSVICGGVRLATGRPDTAINPAVLIEVLSDATRDYDRGEKFALYKSIATFRDYVLIDDRRVGVDHFVKSPGGTWRVHSHRSLADVLPLVSIAVRLSLGDVCRSVYGATPARMPARRPPRRR